MKSSRIAVIDPSAGMAGDMMLGALIDCGLDHAVLTSLPQKLDLPEVTVTIESVMRASLAATKVTVSIAGEVEQPGDVDDAIRHSGHDKDAHSHDHGHHHHHDHGHGHHHGPHRHVAELISRIENAASLSPSVRQKATAVFLELARAEGRVHGMAPEHVTLHEVGAWDALIDIVGAMAGLEKLGVAEVFHRPPAVGTGWVRAAHGQMSVPAPATSVLLEGMILAPNGPVTGEALTPTGAALLKVLSKGPPPDNWRPTSQGWGAGTRDPATHANALRVWLGERTDEAAGVEVVVTDIDDLSPEYLGPLREELQLAGALDVQVWATQMKKGRSGLRVEVQCRQSDLERVSEAFFKHSTTAGVRHWSANRRILARRMEQVEVAGHPIRVKVLDGPDGPKYKPEFDDVAAVARKSGMAAMTVAQQAHDLARMTGAGRNEE